MELPSDSVTNLSHGFTLLKELNSQRGMGQFCDCVLQLRTHPGRLFLAHKSVLAAFSPVLASLLPRHGALVDLNLPYLTPETLDVLLDYIYTGALPPRSQEEAVLSAAFHLQLEQLQQALGWRRKVLTEVTHTVPDKPTQKRRFAEGQSVDGAPLTSPPYYPYGSDPPAASSPSCEVVPVICHVRTAGHNKCQPQTRNQNRSSDHAGPSQQTSPGLANASLLEQFLESAQSKQDKLLAVLSEGSLNELPGVVAEGAGSQFSSDSGELQPENARQATADLPSETECSQTSSHSCPHFNRCDSNGDSIQSFELFDPGKGEHLADTHGLYSTSSSRLKDGSHLHSRPSAETCSDAPAPLCLNGSSRTDSNAVGCQRRPSDPDLWHEIHEAYAPKSMFEGRPLDIPPAEKVADEEEPKRTGTFPQTGKDYVQAYQGQLRYQYTLDPRHPRPDSSDSDSDRAFPAPSAEAKDGSMVLETIDITEISLSARLPPRERSSTHPFQCSMCERAFSQRGSLNRHMRSHLGVRPYSCPRCSMTFSRQYRVTEHMRVHQRSCEGPPQGHLRPAAAGVDV